MCSESHVRMGYEFGYGDDYCNALCIHRARALCSLDERWLNLESLFLIMSFLCPLVFKLIEKTIEYC